MSLTFVIVITWSNQTERPYIFQIHSFGGTMDAVVKTLNVRPLKPTDKQTPVRRPSREEAEAAVRTLIAWAGDDPSREGLIDTPKRVVKAYEEFFEGYAQDGQDVLNKVFEEVA